jgi:hypothetical protein
MQTTLDQSEIEELQQRLNQHPVYGALQSLDDLRIFMQHHVYSVWDFMSLIKYLQNEIAPSSQPWRLPADAAISHFINSLVCEEESDQGMPGDDERPYTSHFELYCRAMREIGADPQGVLDFLTEVARSGIRSALSSAIPPLPSSRFTATTFDFIESGKSHTVAAALAVGREHVIPGMFRQLLDKMGIERSEAPAFHYYLERHIHLDEDFHAPLSLRLLDHLCGNDPVRIGEARAAARSAIEARIAFWDGVNEAIAG